MDYKEKLKVIINSNKTPFVDIDTFLKYFPELKESEDERIRKALINYFKYGVLTPEHPERELIESWLDWLEKQQKTVWHNEDEEPQKDSLILLIMQSGTPIVAKIIEPNHTFNHGERWAYIDDLLEKQGEQNDSDVKDYNSIDPHFGKSIDKIEPKFKVGDWVINKQGNVHQIANVIENVTNHTYGYDTVDGIYFNDSTEGIRLWTIQDAKDGDVLVASDGSIFIFKDMIDGACKHYVALTTDNVVKFNEGLEHYWETSSAVHPATKDQRDALMKAMIDAGWEFDFDKKELKAIEEPENFKGQVMSETADSTKDYITQKPAEWGEEDEKIIQNLLSLWKEVMIEPTCCRFGLHKDKIVDWFKSLKDRIQKCK